MVLTKKKYGGGLSLSRPKKNNNNFVVIGNTNNTELQITKDEALKHLLIAAKKLKETVIHTEDVKRFSDISEEKSDIATSLLGSSENTEEIEQIASEAKIASENATKSLQKVIVSAKSTKDAVKKTLFIAQKLEDSENKSMIIQRAIKIDNDVGKYILMSLKYNSSATLDAADAISVALTASYISVSLYTAKSVLNPLNTQYMTNLSKINNSKRRLTKMQHNTIAALKIARNDNNRATQALEKRKK